MSIRLQGQLLLAGALGSIVWSLFVFLLPGPLGIAGFDSLPTNIVGLLSGLLLLVGLPVLYRAQAKQIGRGGLVGVVLVSVAVILVWLFLSGLQILDDVVVAVPVSLPPGAQLTPPPVALIPAILGGISILIGGVIIGITTIRAHILTPAIGWVILISSVALLATFPIGSENRLLDLILTNSVLVLLYVGLAWAGAALGFRARSTQRSESSVQRN